MKRIRTLLCGVLALFGLAACEEFAIKDLRPGVSTGFEVRDKLGPPGLEWRNDDGTVTWEYTQQPQGVTCYLITIDGSNVVQKVEQVLTEAQFARDTGVSHGTLTPARVGELLFLHNASIVSSVFGRALGRLELGEDADFAVLEPTSHLLDPAARVLRVVSRGRTVYENGQVLDLDLAELHAEADAEAKRLGERISAL